MQHLALPLERAAEDLALLFHLLVRDERLVVARLRLQQDVTRDALVRVEIVVGVVRPLRFVEIGFRFRDRRVGVEPLAFGGLTAVPEPRLRTRDRVLACLRELRRRGDDRGLRLHDGRAVLFGERRVRLGDRVGATARGLHVRLGIAQAVIDLIVHDAGEDLTRAHVVARRDDDRGDVAGGSGRDRRRARELDDARLGKFGRERLSRHDDLADGRRRAAATERERESDRRDDDDAESDEGRAAAFHNPRRSAAAAVSVGARATRRRMKALM